MNYVKRQNALDTLTHLFVSFIVSPDIFETLDLEKPSNMKACLLGFLGGLNIKPDVSQEAIKLVEEFDITGGDIYSRIVEIHKRVEETEGA